jgi:hypothetical protein
MGNPYHTRIIDEDINIDKVWWKEADFGCAFMVKEVDRLNKHISGGKLSYFCYSDKEKRRHEYYLTIEKDD